MTFPFAGSQLIGGVLISPEGVEIPYSFTEFPTRDGLSLTKLTNPHPCQPQFGIWFEWITTTHLSLMMFAVGVVHQAPKEPSIARLLSQLIPMTVEALDPLFEPASAEVEQSIGRQSARANLARPKWF